MEPTLCVSAIFPVQNVISNYAYSMAGESHSPATVSEAVAGGEVLALATLHV